MKLAGKLALVVCTSLLYSTVYAQSTSPNGGSTQDSDSLALPEIMVTAQRRSEPISKVPLSVSVLTSDDLKVAGISQTNELAAVTPSLNISSAYGDAQPNFTLRGIGMGNEYYANQASPVGVYVDDSYLAFRTTHGMQLFDLERVEVLSGPQGTLFGRNTTGGAINIISRKPNLGDDNGYAEVGYGNFNTVRTQAAGEFTMIPDELGVRVAIDYAHGGGMFQNLYPGQPDSSSTDEFAGRVIARFKPIPELDILLRFDMSRANPTQAGVFVIPVGPNGFNPVLNYSGPGLGPYQERLNSEGNAYTLDRNAMLTVGYQLNDALKLTALSTFTDGASAIGEDCDGTSVDACSNLYPNEFWQTNQEARLTYSSAKTTVQGGIYYGLDHIDTANNQRLFAFTGTGVYSHQQFVQVRDSRAIFAQVDQKFFEHWTVTGGLRYTKDRARYEDGLLYDGTPTSSASITPMPVTYAIGSAAGALPTLYGSSGAVTGRAALTYEFDSGAIVYGSYNRGYRAGAFPGQAPSPAAITYVKPETVNAFELGAKDTLFGNRVSLSSALFLSNYDNQQLNEVIDIVQYLVNAGKAQIYGFEFKGDALLAKDVRANVSLSLLHTEYKELVLSGQNLAGNRLPFAPPATFNAGIDWDVARFSDGQLTFSPRVTFQGLTYFEAENSLGPLSDSNMHQNAYAKMNASLAWVRDKLTLRLFVNNAFDKRTYAWGIDQLPYFGQDYLIPAAPRTYGGSMRYDF